MKTLADLKRNAKNYTWRLRKNSFYKDSGLDYPRKVAHMDTVKIGFENTDGRISYLDWPKAKELHINTWLHDSWMIDITIDCRSDRPSHVMTYELNPVA